MQKILWFFYCNSIVFFSHAMEPDTPKEMSELLAGAICNTAFHQDDMFQPEKDNASSLESSLWYQQEISTRIAHLIDKDPKILNRLTNSSPRFVVNDSEEKDPQEIQLELIGKATVQAHADYMRKNQKRAHACIGLGITGVVFSAMVSSAATYLLFGC